MKVNELLKEVNVNPTRLVMPTRENSRAFEKVIDAATQLAEAKKALDKAEYDLLVLNQRRDPSERAETLGPSQSSPPGAGMSSDAMDIEDSIDGGEDVDGREQSVVSARSARSRKKVCVFCFPFYDRF